MHQNIFVCAQILYEPSLVVDLPPGTYSITVEARTEFTILPADGSTLAGPPVLFTVGESSLPPVSSLVPIGSPASPGESC